MQLKGRGVACENCYLFEGFKPNVGFIFYVGWGKSNWENSIVFSMGKRHIYATMLKGIFKFNL